MAFKLNDERPPSTILTGESAHAYEFLGSHFVNWETETASFQSMAPNALSVSVVGDFNNWTATQTLCIKSRIQASGNCSLRECRIFLLQVLRLNPLGRAQIKDRPLRIPL
jgi:hypothetical protein